MSDHASQEPFDYGTLDEQTREIVLRKTDEMHGLMMRTAESIIAIGENLLAVQRHLPDMKFSAWLRAEFDLSRQSAYNFMKVATRLGGSCKTVLQLPARVLYELAFSSDAVIEQVETGQLPPTVDAIKAAREAERQARVEVETRQATIEQLILEIEGLRRRLAEMPAPEIEVREVEKLAGPPKMSLQLDTMRHKIATLTLQRDTLSEQASQLQEQARASTSDAFASTGTRSPASFREACDRSYPGGPHPSMSLRLKPMTGPASHKSRNWPVASSKNALGSHEEPTNGLSTGLKSPPQTRSSVGRPALSEI